MSQPPVLSPLPSSTPDAAASDPSALGWMKGAPPPRERQIRFASADMGRFPQMRWAVAHARELLPTARVWRGGEGASPLRRTLQDDLDAVRFRPLRTITTMRWDESLLTNYTDGIVVLHRGELVYERYFGGFQPHQTHLCWSVTKSLVATVAAVLIHQGLIDEAAPVTQYLPELASGGWGTARVRDVLDMTCALDYDENYGATDSAIMRYAMAVGTLPRPEGYAGPETIYDFLRTVGPAQGKEHGQVFDYLTVNTDVLAWIIQRVTGLSLAGALEAFLWKPLRAEEDGEIVVDAAGIGFGGGGYGCTTRDLARFGQMLLDNGESDGRRIVPAEAVARIRRGGDTVKFAPAGYSLLQGWSYGAMWWHTHNAHGAYMARGIHGQNLYIDPVAHVVIARHASHPGAFGAYSDPTTLPAYHALALHLMGQV